MISFCLFLFEVGEPMPRPSQMSAACVCVCVQRKYVSTQSSFSCDDLVAGLVQLPHEWSSLS